MKDNHEVNLSNEDLTFKDVNNTSSKTQIPNDVKTKKEQFLNFANLNELSVTLKNRLFKQLKERIFYHLILYFLHALRNKRYMQFLKIVYPQCEYVIKSKDIAELWTRSVTDMVKQAQEKLFTPVELFNIDFEVKEADFLVKNEKGLVKLLQTLMVFVNKINDLYQFNEQFKLNYALNEYFNYLKKYLTEIVLLHYFNDGHSKSTNIAAYFYKMVGDNKIDDWFKDNNDDRNILDDLIWPNSNGAGEDVCVQYESKMLFYNLACYDYLTKHGELFTHLKSYIYEDYIQNDKTNSALTSFDHKLINTPNLVFFYEDSNQVKLALNQTNNFVQFDNNIRNFNNLDANGNYNDFLASSIINTQTIDTSPFLVTNFYHKYLKSINTYDTFNHEFSLQLTNYNNLNLASSYCLLVEDTSHSSKISNLHHAILPHLNKIAELQIQLQTFTNKNTLQYQALENERRQLINEYTLINSKDLLTYETLKLALDTLSNNFTLLNQVI